MDLHNQEIAKQLRNGGVPFCRSLEQLQNCVRYRWWNVHFDGSPEIILVEVVLK